MLDHIKLMLFVLCFLSCILRIVECALKNIVGNFCIMHFLGETLSNFFAIIFAICFIVGGKAENMHLCMMRCGRVGSISGMMPHSNR